MIRELSSIVHDPRKVFTDPATAIFPMIWRFNLAARRVWAKNLLKFGIPQNA